MTSRSRQIIEAERKFMAAVAEKGWVALGPYVDCKTPVLIQCQNGHQFPRGSKHIKDTKGCPDCPTPAFIEARDNFYRRVAEQNGTVIGEYLCATAKIDIRCHLGHTFRESATVINNTVCWCKECEKDNGITTEDKVRGTIAYRGGTLVSPFLSTGKMNIRCAENDIFDSNAGNILAGSWCKFCSKYSTDNHRANFLRIVQSKGGTLLDPFVNSNTPIRIQCQNLHVWPAWSTHVVRDNSWCPDCPTPTMIAAREKFYEEVRQKRGVVVGNYVDTHTHVMVRCEFGHEVPMYPQSVSGMMDTWCKKCSNNCPEQAAENFYDKVARSRGKCITPYVRAYDDVIIECEFGHHFKSYPHLILSTNCWCTVCKESWGERMVRLFLTKHGLPIVPQKRHPKIPSREYDFWTIYNERESYIEYDGGQHFKRTLPFHETLEIYEERRQADILKTQTILQAGLSIIRLDDSLKEYEIELHLAYALQNPSPLYLSNPRKYQWILDAIAPTLETMNIQVATFPIPPVPSASAERIQATSVPSGRIQAKPVSSGRIQAIPVTLPLKKTNPPIPNQAKSVTLQIGAKPPPANMTPLTDSQPPVTPVTLYIAAKPPPIPILPMNHNLPIKILTIKAN